MLALAATFVYRMWGQQLLTVAMVPGERFIAQVPVSESAYARANMWYARPELGMSNPALWTPANFTDHPDDAPARRAAIFFVHPTSYINRAHWNGPIDDPEASERAILFIKGQASAFNAVGDVWAPKYRQATFGAFLTDKPEAQKALDAAYNDVARAFDAFLKANPKAPIILAGHSQGSLHLLRLLKEKVAGTPLAKRIVAVYAVGWPVSLEADIPALGLPACTERGQSGCIISWQSFAEPADPSAIRNMYDASTGFTGLPRKDTHILCINPLTGTPDSAAAATHNLGTLKPDEELKDATLVEGTVPARCARRGFLMIGDPPELGPYVLPGNNYHVYDYSLFWANVRRDAKERLNSFLKQ